MGSQLREFVSNSWYRLHKMWAGIFFLIIGVLFIIGPSIWGGRVPGDLDDGRLNIYILEHDFLFFTGHRQDYWTGSFFYHFPLSIAFSDNLLGSSPIYIFFRLLGVDRYSSFNGWYLIGAILNYAAVFFSMRRLLFSTFASGLGAFFYAFGLPVTGQDHLQLVYRFAVPFALTEVFLFFYNQTIRRMFTVFFLIVLQFYLGIYMGVFLILAVIAECISFFIWSRLKNFKMKNWQSNYRLLVELPISKKILILGTFFSSLVMLSVLFIPYLEVVRIYHFHRSWSETESMLPRPTSYLLADHSLLYSNLSHLIQGIPMRGEHQLFIGFAPLFLITIAFFFNRGKKYFSDLIIVMSLAFLIVVLMTLDLGGHSFYRVIAIIPGFNSIRSVTRIILLLVFFIALFLGRAWDTLDNHDGLIAKFLPYLLVFLIILESIFVRQLTYSKNVAEKRIETIGQSLPTHLPLNPILVIKNSKGNPFVTPYLTEVDGMIAAQTWGWKTLNGYAANNPPGYYSGQWSCKIISQRIWAYLKFKGKVNASSYLSIKRRVVPIGFEGCPTN
jgi:hypothetical protein